MSGVMTEMDSMKTFIWHYASYCSQAAESLFPTTKAFGYFFDDYRSEKFINHTDALNLWLNLTTDLISKVQVWETNWDVCIL